MRMYAVYGLGGLRRRAVGSVKERLMFGVGWVKPTGIAARGFHPPYVCWKVGSTPAALFKQTKPKVVAAKGLNASIILKVFNRK